MSDPQHARAGGAILTLGALGVVFGDIGTSPLYAVQTVFSRNADRVVDVGRTEIYGSISLIFWAVTLIVTVKYVLFVLSADNDGEGGLMSLIALLRRIGGGAPLAVGTLAAVGIFGAALFFGDSMITPAISVLSAVEGLEVVQPSLDHLVVPLAAAILVGLFVIQAQGTEVVGRLFGPVMLVWFVSIGVVGVHGIARHPDALKALSPTYGLSFLGDQPLTAFLALGGVVLAVTGAEAIYADMGHFGRGPIRRAWLLVAFPALTLNYLGQGALLVEDPGGASNPFYLLVPHWARIPMVILACMATVIASQAVISGAYSVTRQAVQLGYLPRLRILHTSRHAEGQVYVPFVNWLLFAAVMVLIFAFQRSEKLAAAYGIAVTGTITITLTLFLSYVRASGRWRSWQIVLAAAVFGTVDVVFLGANLAKVLTGGWLPLVVGLCVFVVLDTWQRGRAIVTRNRERLEGRLAEFVEVLRITQPPVQRVPGTAVFLNRGTKTTPLAMRENVEHNHTLHRHALIVSIETLPVPYVAEDERLEVRDLGYRDDGISLLVARYGFQEQPDVPAIVRRASDEGRLEAPCDFDDITYFLSKIEIVQTDAPGLPLWRKRLFLATAHVAADAVDYFRLPRRRTVLLGSAVEI